MRQGDDIRVIVDVVDGDGNPIDITAAESIKWQAAANASSMPVIEKSLVNGIEINTPTSFMFDISAPESEILNGNYYHEAEIINDQGLIYTPIYGRLTVSKTLIKPE